MKRSVLILVLACLCAGVYGTTGGKGIFTVAAGKTVQFANANESGLVKWANLPAPSVDGWYVPDSSEWTYLLVTRGEDLNAEGTVDGHKGLIILPDGWVQPAGVPNWKGNLFYFDANTYTASEWDIMEASGAVFLPCNGYGMDEPSYHVENPDDWGAYWSSDAYNAENAYSIHFGNGVVHNQNYYSEKGLYYNVRLVREVVVLDEQDEAAAFAEKMGNANLKKDYAFVRRSLKKDGTFYTLCLPFDVPDIDNSPLAGAEVFTFDGGTVSGTTGNEELHLTLTPLEGTRLYQGVPYVLRWTNTGETLSFLHFEEVANWDADTDAGSDPGNETIKFHGVYPKAHIPGYESGDEPHYNFFMGANNTLYWPDDTTYGTSAKMKGFRAYFYITSGGGPSAVAKYRTMPTVWKIRDVATGMENGEWTNGEWRKELRDGQVYLMYEGKMYDVQGREIKSERVKE